MFNKRVKIKELLSKDDANYEATVMGWVRTFRNNQFIALNDGSTNNNLQVVVTLGAFDEAILKRLTTGACIKATGEVVASLGKGQLVDSASGTADGGEHPWIDKQHETVRCKPPVRWGTLFWDP